MIDIDTEFNHLIGYTLKMKYIRDFIIGVSSVKHMLISHRSLKDLIYCCPKLGLITKFHNLSRLEVTFCNLLLQALPSFLEICPNLRHLTMYLADLMTTKPENLELTNVPQCLQLTLECVEIKEVLTREDTGMMRVRTSKHKKRISMEVTRYFLENSILLKALVLCLTDSDTSKELLRFTKLTRKCQVIFR